MKVLRTRKLDRFFGCCDVQSHNKPRPHPDDGGSDHLRNVSENFKSDDNRIFFYEYRYFDIKRLSKRIFRTYVAGYAMLFRSSSAM